MSFQGSANPAQLAILRQALEDWCRLNDIKDDNDRNDAGEMVMSIFVRGVDTYDGIMAGMKSLSLNRPASPA